MNILIGPPILTISANKTNAMLCKLWQFVSVTTIKSIYYTIFTIPSFICLYCMRSKSQL